MNRNNKYMSPEMIEIQRVQKSLPVFGFKEDIKQTVINNVITLIVGETGSGKTTQIPQYLMEWNEVTINKKIVCTQPRTVAAQSVAQRVSEEQGECIGNTVGYHIRLDRKIKDNQTKLEYMTEGVLLRKAMNCDNLSEYKIVIIDEAHERTVNADLLMGFLKEMVINRNNDLRVIIMSATLDTERFKAYFNNPPIIKVPGSTNPVQHHWLNEATENYVDLTIKTIKAIHLNDKNVEYDRKSNTYKPNGHILVFLTGQNEIDLVVKTIRDEALTINNNNKYRHNLEIYPLYSALSTEDRKKAFKEPSQALITRKCVVATNIAETSLTISNVVYVIDCGLSKQNVYSASKGLEILGIRGISKASVMQRCGRSGRVKPGITYHLYTKMGYIHFLNETPAEILRSGLVNETLSMLALGMKNPLKFDFIDPPNEMTMARALHILKNLNAIDNQCKITKIGEKMAKFPVNPRMAKSLVIAKDYNCIYEIVTIAAMMEIEERLWRKPRKDHKKQIFKKKKQSFYHCSGDHLTLLNVYNAYKLVKQNNISDIRQFCDENFLNYNSLKRADDIKKQIENILANIMREEVNNNNNNQCVIFNINQTNHCKYYENIIKALLSGHFMNIAVKGFGDNYWRFRLINLDERGKEKAIDIIDKAKCHQNSIFHKNNSMNWIIFHDVTITHVTQLKILTAIKPIWLTQINSNWYYKIQSLINDATPISQIIKQQQQQ